MNDTISFKKGFFMLPVLFAFSVLLTGCGKDPKTAKFESDIQYFCDEVTAIDANINNISADEDGAVEELLTYLDQLDETFKVLSQLSVPEEYSYLENLTTEASSYMSTAVAAYHDAFGGESYDAAVAEYARENYTRAYKRVTVMLKLLRGEDITDDGVMIEQGNR